MPKTKKKRQPYIGPFLVTEEVKKEFDLYYKKQNEKHGSSKNFIATKIIKEFLDSKK